MVRISILSDDKILFDGLRRILSTDSSFTIVPVAEQRTTSNAVCAAGTDVLLVDTRIEDALDVCARLTKDGAGTSVILMEVPDDDTSAINALSAGARGILQRSAESEDVARAIRVVFRGQVWAPRHVIVAAWMRALKREPSERRTARVVKDARLTAREMQVLHCAAAGLGNKEVAKRLAITEATVKVHLTRIFQKLGLRGRARLAAAYHGIATPVEDVDTTVITRARRPA